MFFDYIQFISITLGAIVTAILTAWFAFWRYKKQKDYENINNRYFQAGFEDLISHFNNTRMVLEHNYAESLKMLRNFIDLDYEEFKAILPKNQDYQRISAMMPSSFSISSSLIGSRVFAEWCIDNFIKPSAVNDFF